MQNAFTLIFALYHTSYHDGTNQTKVTRKQSTLGRPGIFAKPRPHPYVLPQLNTRRSSLPTLPLRALSIRHLNVLEGSHRHVVPSRRLHTLGLYKLHPDHRVSLPRQDAAT
jgi:hypothetical protein